MAKLKKAKVEKLEKIETKLSKWAKAIHGKAKEMREKDKNKLAYKQYVSLASAELKKEGFFSK